MKKAQKIYHIKAANLESLFRRVNKIDSLNKRAGKEVMSYMVYPIEKTLKIFLWK